jgi:hypothetical protein
MLSLDFGTLQKVSIKEILSFATKKSMTKCPK